jgi:hypothetical protein
VLGDQRLELAHHVDSAERQIGLDAVAQHVEPTSSSRAISACANGASLRSASAGPRQSSRASRRHSDAGAGVPRRRARPAVAGQRAEAVEIQRAGSPRAGDSRRARDEHAGIEDLAQRRHVDLDELGRGRRGRSPHSSVDESVAREHPPRCG